MKIAVIGAGWYGAHIARVLRKAGHDVTVYEKNPDIFSELSGKYGVRLHKGPHYPRSAKTRKYCQKGYTEFLNEYPELVNKHAYSIYGLGKKDADGEPSKINYETFKSVCEESEECHQINPKAWGYRQLISAMDIEESSIAGGKRIRETFRKYLDREGIKIVCNFEVKKLEEHPEGVVIYDQHGQNELFDYVVNATSYQSLLPDEATSLFGMEIIYQPCLALIYKDTKPTTSLPISFIVIDGWYPCVMPYDDRIECEEDAVDKRYVMLTHGKWTILGSYKTAEEAKENLAQINNKFVEDNIKPLCEAEIKRFWPAFDENRFEYVRWSGSVLAKVKTKSEYRSAIAYEKNNIIYIIPGKVSNIFDIGREVLSLINNQNILSHNDYRYVQDGALNESIMEIRDKPDASDKRNTCNLQTQTELHQTAALERITLPPLQHLSTFSIWQQPLSFMAQQSKLGQSSPASIRLSTNQ